MFLSSVPETVPLSVPDLVIPDMVPPSTPERVPPSVPDGTIPDNVQPSILETVPPTIPPSAPYQTSFDSSSYNLLTSPPSLQNS
jgi:hypothetical protein